VTFNPQVQESLLEVANEPPKPATLKEVADIVVRCLDPFYKQGKFATKVREARFSFLRVSAGFKLHFKIFLIPRSRTTIVGRP